MIKLTKSDGRPLYLNIDNIISISGYDQADIITCEDCYRVTESPEEVVRKIMEYKLGMIRYASADAESMKSHGDPVYLSDVYEAALKELAGLEDSDA